MKGSFALSLFKGRDGKPVATEAMRQQEKEANDAIKSAYEDRLRLIKDFNAEETRIKAESYFNQKQDLESFYFSQDQLLKKGRIAQAYDSAVEKNFSQKQAGERLRFEAGQRTYELERQLSELAGIVQQPVQLQIAASPEFDVRVQQTARSASVQVLSQTTRIS